MAERPPSTSIMVRPGDFGSPDVAMFAVTGEVPPTIRLWMMAGLLVALSLIELSGIDLAGPQPTVFACAAILLLGLPHGTLDLAIIRRERDAGRAAMGILLLCYLGLAALMAAIWQFAPVVALAIFLMIAAVHFAEDWRAACPPFLAQAMALALLSAPALFHLTELEQLFVALADTGDAAMIADILLLLAPMSLAVATVAIWTMWQAGGERQAIAGTITLAGMILLPPVVGFALFFALHHSPSHLKVAMSRTSGGRAMWLTIAMLTLASLGISAALFIGEARAELSDQFVSTSFLTLSLLTIPHMIIPAVVEALPSNRFGGPPPTRRRNPAIAEQVSNSMACFKGDDDEN